MKDDLFGQFDSQVVVAVGTPACYPWKGPLAVATRSYGLEGLSFSAILTKLANESAFILRMMFPRWI